MAVAVLHPNDRYAFIGKTRSGKTSLAMVLAGTYARALPAPWQVWWVDTKGDPDDIAALRKWGFRNAASKVDTTQRGGLANAFYFRLETEDKEGNEIDVVPQVQFICRVAYNRTKVLVVIDEYAQVVLSRQNPGKALLNLFQRGGGRKSGLMGLTQEPVFIPRQLISQATHIAIFSLTYDYDIKYARRICPEYQVPLEMGDPHGFWWSWVDGRGDWQYYPNQSAWYEKARLQLNKPVIAVNNH